MEKNHFTEFFEYNKWANDKYRDVLRTVKFEDLKIETELGNLLERIVHIFASFEMWKERMNGKSPTRVIKFTDFDNWRDLEERWQDVDMMMIDYVKTLDSEDLQKTVTYTSFDHNVYSRKIRHILTHLTQHPTYHRGQISTVFKQNSLPNLPATDAVIYFLQYN